MWSTRSSPTRPATALKKARRLLKEKYRNKICVKLALRTCTLDLLLEDIGKQVQGEG